MLCCAHLERGVLRDALLDGRGAGASELLEEFDMVEATEEVGEVVLDGEDMPDSWIRSAWSAKVLQAASMSSGWTKPRRMRTLLPSTSGAPPSVGLYA